MAHAHINTTEDGREVVVRHALPAEFIMTRRILYYVLDVIELFIATRFVLKLLGANAASGFVSFMYSVTDPLVAPFRGIVAQTAVSSGVFEWASLFAILVYAVVAYLLVRLIRMMFR